MSQINRNIFLVKHRIGLRSAAGYFVMKILPAIIIVQALYFLLFELR